jgi:hypothetical protein
MNAWKIRLIRFFLAMAVGAVAGAVLGVALKDRLARPRPSAATARDARQNSGESLQAVRAAGENSPALLYARAIQSGDWDAVIDRTYWMQERLRRVQLESGTAEMVAAAREALRNRVSERNVSENRLRQEGVEDQYVFAPEAALELVGVDAGRKDLGPAAAQRVWLRVLYPSRGQALRDVQNVPIRALKVGVNVTADGIILKAGIAGNLEIDRDSIEYWTSGRGEK